MRIAFIGQRGLWVGEGTGGMERHVAEIAPRLVAKGHAVTVYARGRYAPPSRPSTEHAVRVLYIPTFYTKSLETIMYTFFSTLHALFQPYDILHYHGVGPATLAWIPRLFKRKARVVVTFHSQDRFHQKWGPVARAYLRFGEWAAVRFPHACIAVSHVIQVYVRDVLRRQAIYIPNGAHPQFVTADHALRRFGLTKKGYLLNVGRIVPQKGLQYIIEAFGGLRTDKRLVIAGEPSFSERYEREMRRRAKADPRIVFLGQVEGESLWQLYAHAFLYVQPSEFEGLSVAVLEAMSVGTAVLVSDIPENVEAIHHHGHTPREAGRLTTFEPPPSSGLLTGFTFANRDSKDLAERLRSLLADPALVERVGREGQELVRREFSWDMIVERIEAVYISLRH